MSWARRWRIDSRGKWRAILTALIDMSVDFARNPCELIVRNVREEKTHGDRKLFHAVCADIAPHWGMTPGATKTKVKEDFYGATVSIEPGRLSTEELVAFKRLLDKLGHYEVVVQSSEDSDREEYCRMIDHAYQMAAESEIQIPDRRTR